MKNMSSNFFLEINFSDNDHIIYLKISSKKESYYYSYDIFDEFLDDKENYLIKIKNSNHLETKDTISINEDIFQKILSMKKQKFFQFNKQDFFKIIGLDEYII